MHSICMTLPQFIVQRVLEIEKPKSVPKLKRIENCTLGKSKQIMMNSAVLKVILPKNKTLS